MGKIRTVKPDLYRHLELFDVERATGLPLRLSFTGLFTCCDREGRFRWQARVLKLDILPFDEVDFEAVLTALSDAGLIKKYTVDNKIYGYIPSWHTHQRINAREPDSVLPSPNEEISNDVVSEKENGSSPPVEKNALQAETQPKETPVITVSSLDKQHTSHTVSVKNELRVVSDLSKIPVSFSKNQNVTAVFEHWKKTFACPEALLDKKRLALIEQALKNGYSVTQLCEAINGCAKTPYNQGDNAQGQHFNGLHVILRDADQIERFIRHASYPPRSGCAEDKLLQANLSVARQWLQASGAEA